MPMGISAFRENSILSLFTTISNCDIITGKNKGAGEIHG